MINIKIFISEMLNGGVYKLLLHNSAFKNEGEFES